MNTAPELYLGKLSTEYGLRSSCYPFVENYLFIIRVLSCPHVNLRKFQFLFLLFSNRLSNVINFVIGKQEARSASYGKIERS
jgi:hypothetical protein